jgi:hypothetical protein
MADRPRATAAAPTKGAQPDLPALIRIASDLVGLMRQETEALRSLSLTTIPDFVARKTVLAERYAAAIRPLRADPDTLAALSDAVRAELREIFTAFDTALRENQTALAAARSANERVLRAIIDAAETQRPRAQGYGRGGAAMTPRPGQRAETALSVAFDQRL